MIFYRLDICKNCGDPLEHKATGRPRRFCGARCRVAHRRAMKRWAHESIDAILVGDPEPALPGARVCIEGYEVGADGAVTKRVGPGSVRKRG